MERFSKPLSPYMNLISCQGCELDFHKESHIVEERYVFEPKRSVCCNCGLGLEASHDFTRNPSSAISIPYFICRQCTHINGGYKVTESFIDDLYSTSMGDPLYDWAFYCDASEDAFEKRLSDIYLPKVEFLIESLSHEGVEATELRLLDVGAGSGHFVESARRLGFAASGIEPNEAAVRASRTYGAATVTVVPAGETVEFVRTVECEVLSMICLLPHLENVEPLLGAIRDNTSIRYVFQLLPLFSLSAALDIATPSLTSRVLSGAHTHLHTSDSLKYLESKWGFERVAAWWFGTDLPSLSGVISRGLSEQIPESKQQAVDSWLANQLKLDLDGLQSTLDQNRQSDQVHLLWKIIR